MVQEFKLEQSIEALIFAANIDESEKKEKINDLYEVFHISQNDLGKAIQNDKFKAIFKEQNSEVLLAITDAITQNFER